MAEDSLARFMRGEDEMRGEGPNYPEHDENMMPEAEAHHPAAAARPRYKIPENFEQVAGFESDQTTAATSPNTLVTLTAQPQRDFYGRRIVLNSSLGNLSPWILQNLQVGTTGQFVTNQGQVPAGVFENIAVGVRLKMNKSKPGVNIVAGVLLTSTLSPGDFVTGACIGPAASAE